MTETLVHALIAIRKTCQDTRRAVDNDPRTAGLDQAASVLTRLIVDLTELPVFQSAAAQRYGELLPAAGDTTKSSYGLFSHAAQERLRRPAGKMDAEFTALMRAIIDAELAMTSHYEQAIIAESAKTPAQPTADTAADGFDGAAVKDYLRTAFPDETQLEIADGRVASVGFSKKTWLVKLSGTRSLPTELVLRVDRPYNYLGTTVLDEFPVLAQLYASGVRVPKPLALEATGKYLGNPFIVFDKAEGTTIANNYVLPARDPGLCADVGACLAATHAVPTGGLAIGQLDTTPEQRLIAQIDKYYDDWAALNADSPIVEAAFTWIRANMALGLGDETLVHGDYNFNNMLVADGRVSAVLDWEFARLGHPGDDLGYFFYAAEACGSWELFLDSYAEAGGRVPPKQTLDFYILWGQLRLAVMCYQVEVGFAAGKWAEIKFAMTGALFIRKAVLRVGTKLQELLAETA